MSTYTTTVVIFVTTSASCMFGGLCAGYMLGRAHAEQIIEQRNANRAAQKEGRRVHMVRP